MSHDEPTNLFTYGMSHGERILIDLALVVMGIGLGLILAGAFLC